MTQRVFFFYCQKYRKGFLIKIRAKKRSLNGHSRIGAPMIIIINNLIKLLKVPISFVFICEKNKIKMKSTLASHFLSYSLYFFQFYWDMEAEDKRDTFLLSYKFYFLPFPRRVRIPYHTIKVSSATVSSGVTRTL